MNKMIDKAQYKELEAKVEYQLERGTKGTGGVFHEQGQVHLPAKTVSEHVESLPSFNHSGAAQYPPPQKEGNPTNIVSPILRCSNWKKYLKSIELT